MANEIIATESMSDDNSSDEEMCDRLIQEIRAKIRKRQQRKRMQHSVVYSDTPMRDYTLNFNQLFIRACTSKELINSELDEQIVRRQLKELSECKAYNYQTFFDKLKSSKIVDNPEDLECLNQDHLKQENMSHGSGRCYITYECKIHKRKWVIQQTGEPYDGEDIHLADQVEIDRWCKSQLLVFGPKRELPQSDVASSSLFYTSHNSPEEVDKYFVPFCNIVIERVGAIFKSAGNDRSALKMSFIKAARDWQDEKAIDEMLVQCGCHPYKSTTQLNQFLAPSEPVVVARITELLTSPEAAPSTLEPPKQLKIEKGMRVTEAAPSLQRPPNKFTVDVDVGDQSFSGKEIMVRLNLPDRKRKRFNISEMSISADKTQKVTKKYCPSFVQ